MNKRITCLFFLIFLQSLIQKSFSQAPKRDVHIHHLFEENEISPEQRYVLKGTQILPFFYPLLKNIKKVGLPVRYLIQSLLLVDQVSFVQFKDEDIKGTYNKMTNMMRLGEDFIITSHTSSTGENFQIKSLENLTKIQITTLFHELWHVFLERYVKRSRPLLFHLYQQQLSQHYQGQIYGNIYQNEAYGVYIDQVILNYLNHYERFKKVTPEIRQKFRDSPDMKRHFFQANNLPVYGYRYSLFERGVVFSDVNLSNKDRKLIYQYIFKEEISVHLNENFKEDLFK